jgi:hypothetical protein
MGSGPPHLTKRCLEQGERSEEQSGERETMIEEHEKLKLLDVEFPNYL